MSLVRGLGAIQENPASHSTGGLDPELNCQMSSSVESYLRCVTTSFAPLTVLIIELSWRLFWLIYY